MDFDKNTRKSDYRNNNGIAHEVLLEQKPNVQILKQVERSKNFVNYDVMEWLHRHFDQAVSKELLLLGYLVLSLDAFPVFGLEELGTLDAVEDHWLEPVCLKVESEIDETMLEEDPNRVEGLEGDLKVAHLDLSFIVLDCDVGYAVF